MFKEPAKMLLTATSPSLVGEKGLAMMDRTGVVEIVMPFEHVRCLRQDNRAEVRRTERERSTETELVTSYSRYN